MESVPVVDFLGQPVQEPTAIDPFAAGLFLDSGRKTAPEVLLVGAGPSGLLLALCRHGIRPRLVDALLGQSPLSRALRLPWVRLVRFRTVAQIAIAYPNSPLSQGAAPGMAGGMRLP